MTDGRTDLQRLEVVVLVAAEGRDALPHLAGSSGRRLEVWLCACGGRVVGWSVLPWWLAEGRSRTFCTAQLPPPRVAVIEVRRSIATERTGERVKSGSALRRISAASSWVQQGEAWQG